MVGFDKVVNKEVEEIERRKVVSREDGGRTFEGVERLVENTKVARAVNRQLMEHMH